MKGNESGLNILSSQTIWAVFLALPGPIGPD